MDLGNHSFTQSCPNSSGRKIFRALLYMAKLAIHVIFYKQDLAGKSVNYRNITEKFNVDVSVVKGAITSWCATFITDVMFKVQTRKN